MIRFIYVMLLVLCFTAAAVQAKTLLILGDSLSAGYGLSQQQSWVYLLQQKLKEQNTGWTLVNASISGETSGGGLARLPALLEQHKPDYVLIELGANDGLRGFPVPQLEANLNAMVQQIKQQQSKAVLMQIRIPPNYGPRYTKLFTELYPKIAEQQQYPAMAFLYGDHSVKTAMDASRRITSESGSPARDHRFNATFGIESRIKM